MPDHDPDDILQIPYFIVPWHYVPGRPPPPRDPELPPPIRSGEPWDDSSAWDDDPLTWRQRLRERARRLLRRPATRRRDRWHALCDRLAVHYRWYGYPTAETRILLAAEGPAADALPDDPWDHGGWSARNAAAARACCERYLRTDPDCLPPLAQRGLRYYDSLATPSTIAAFATACEELRLNPEDAIVLALHSLCVNRRTGHARGHGNPGHDHPGHPVPRQRPRPEIVPDSPEQIM